MECVLDQVVCANPNSSLLKYGAQPEALLGSFHPFQCGRSPNVMNSSADAIFGTANFCQQRTPLQVLTTGVQKLSSRQTKGQLRALPIWEVVAAVALRISKSNFRSSLTKWSFTCLFVLLTAAVAPSPPSTRFRSIPKLILPPASLATKTRPKVKQCIPRWRWDASAATKSGPTKM